MGFSVQAGQSARRTHLPAGLATRSRCQIRAAGWQCGRGARGGGSVSLGLSASAMGGTDKRPVRHPRAPRQVPAARRSPSAVLRTQGVFRKASWGCQRGPSASGL